MVGGGGGGSRRNDDDEDDDDDDEALREWSSRLSCSKENRRSCDPRTLNRASVAEEEVVVVGIVVMVEWVGAMDTGRTVYQPPPRT